MALQRAQPLRCLPAKDALYQRVEQRPQQARLHHEVQGVDDTRLLRREILVLDAGRPGLEEERRVHQLDCGAGRTLKGHVDRLEGQACQATLISLP